MTGRKRGHLRVAPGAGTPLGQPALLAAHLVLFFGGAGRGRQEGRRLARIGRIGRHRAGAQHGRGRAEQPDGRHTPNYLANVSPDRGMYPVGGARRVTAENDTGVDDDRGHSDANQRFKIDKDGKVTR